MLQHIIDRRLAGKNKSIGNRERFLRRYKAQVKEAVQRAVNGRSIRELEQGEDICIPKQDLSEPVFHHGEGGSRDMVHPGNREFVRGDLIDKPPMQDGQGGAGEASHSGEGEDDFVFSLTKEEFMQFFFEDLALPNLVKTALSEIPAWQQHRAGYSSEGTPNNLHVVRSMRGAIGRRIALGASVRQSIMQLEAAIMAHQANAPDNQFLRKAWQQHADEMSAQLMQLKRRQGAIPYLDPIDLKYRHRVKVAVPTSQAVMFCVMDVSGSMDEQRKELSKRFFILLYLFLNRHYEKIDLVFIRHHTQAQEVTEDEFFHATETGGTVVSSALVLLDQIMQARYPSESWNIYVAQASDGDNWHHDSRRCSDILSTKILSKVRYFAYLQVAETEQNLWDEYLALNAEYAHFAMRKVLTADDIYPVFRDLFKKDQAKA